MALKRAYGFKSVPNIHVYIYGVCIYIYITSISSKAKSAWPLNFTLTGNISGSLQCFCIYMTVCVHVVLRIYLNQTVWADNADFCARQYTGTGALKTDFTRYGRIYWCMYEQTYMWVYMYMLCMCAYINQYS